MPNVGGGAGPPGDIVKLVVESISSLLTNKNANKCMFCATINNVFTDEFLVRELNIPYEDIDFFYHYVETKDIDEELFDEGNEIELFEHLLVLRDEFLNQDAAIGKG